MTFDSAPVTVAITCRAPGVEDAFRTTMPSTNESRPSRIVTTAAVVSTAVPAFSGGWSIDDVCSSVCSAPGLLVSATSATSSSRDLSRDIVLIRFFPHRDSESPPAPALMVTIGGRPGGGRRRAG